MTAFEIILSLSAVVASGVVSYYALRLSRTAGSDMKRDPERVAVFVENSPFERLDNVLAK